MKISALGKIEAPFGRNLARTLPPKRQRVFAPGVPSSFRAATSEAQKSRNLELFSTGLKNILGKADSKGHTFVHLGVAEQYLVASLKWNPQEVHDACRRFVAIQSTQPRLVREMGLEDIFLDPVHDILGKIYERQIAQQVKALLQQPTLQVPPDLARFRPREGITLNFYQCRAIERGMTEPLLIITGGPGVGKTTIQQVLVEELKRRGQKVALTAPTATAAKRLSVATGEEAQTLHRFLKYVPTGPKRFRPSLELITEDVLIVDEVSMLDAETAANLFMRIDPKRTRLILVGDPDQLPSVRAGQVLADLLADPNVKRVALQQPYRNDYDSPMEALARAVKEGQLPDWKTLEKSGRIRFMRNEGALNDIVEWAMNSGLARNPFPEKTFKPLEIDDIQGMAPTWKIIRPLNEHLQKSLLGVDAPEFGSTQRFWNGSRVIQKVNSYQLGVVNGEMGKVIDTNPLLVDFFDGDIVEFPKMPSEDEMDLAYFTTFHRMQGKECRGAIIVVEGRVGWRALYTGLTRLKGPDSRLLIVGSMRDFERSILDRSEDERHTLLPYFLHN